MCLFLYTFNQDDICMAEMQHNHKILANYNKIYFSHQKIYFYCLKKNLLYMERNSSRHLIEQTKLIKTK